MPRPIPVPVRQIVFRLWEHGQVPSQISATLGLPCSTVRRLIRRIRLRGTAGLDPDYYHDRDLAASGSDLRKAAVRYRQEHPTWGAGVIRIHLLEKDSGDPVPSVRTLQRWFLQADLTAAPAGRRPKTNAARATNPHETWQMDAKELIGI